MSAIEIFDIFIGVSCYMELPFIYL